MNRLLVSLIAIFSVFSNLALALPEGNVFRKEIREIVETNRSYVGEVDFDLRDEILTTSHCQEFSSKEASAYFLKEVMQLDSHMIGPKQRAISEVYFESSGTFIFCHKNEDKTRGEYILYDSIINMDERDYSLTIIRDRSEGTVIDL